MKNKIVTVLVLAVMFGGTVYAAEAGQAGAAAKFPALQAEKKARAGGFAEVLEKVDAVERPLLDLEARYWAWDIQNLKRTSYEELQKLAQHWIIKPDTRDLLFKKMKADLDAGAVKALSKEESAALEESKARIRLILSPGKGDTKLIESLSMDYCIDLDARYWARRIQDGEAGIMEKAKTKWPLAKDLRAKLVAAMEKKLEGKNELLTRDELYKFDACGAKLFGQP